MGKKVLLMVVATLLANLLGRYVFDFCVLNHIDLLRSIFVGLFVTCVLAVCTQKTVLPAAFGVGSTFGDIIYQVVQIFHIGVSK